MSGVQMVSPFDRILYLKTLPSLGELSSAQLSRLAAEATEAQFGPGDTLFQAGEMSPGLFVLASGTVRLVRGEDRTLSAAAGDTIGLISLLAEGGGVTAIAETPVVALRIAHQRILEMLEEDFELLQNTIRIHARIEQHLLTRAIGGTHRAPWAEGIEIPEDRELDVLERLILVRQGAIFSSVGLEAAVMLATSMVQERWPAGEPLWEIGDPSGSLHIIVDGEIDCQLKDQTSFVAGLGYPLGNIESLAQKSRWYRPVPRTTTTTLRADHESFFDVMEDDFEVAEVFLAAMARGILHTMDGLAARGESVDRLDSS